jgi:hypothetical protein
MATPEKRTFHIEVRNNRGKVVLERDVDRNSQWSAHGAARNIFRDQPTGTTMSVSLGGKVIEEWTMHSDGYTFEVKNGASVVAASRSLRQSARARGSKPSRSTKATKVTHGRNVKAAARKVSTSKAARAKAAATAASPF